MFLHFPIYFNYTSLQFFLQIEGFGTVQFLHRRVAMQEGKALCKAPPFIKNEWLACHFFKITAELSSAEGFSGKKNEFLMRAFHFAKPNHFSASFI